MSQEIQEQLHKQQEVIADKQMSVKEDLDKVEPAVIEAQNGMLALTSMSLYRSWSMIQVKGKMPVFQWASGLVPLPGGIQTL